MVVEIDLKQLYGDTAKLSDLPAYVEKAVNLAGSGNEVILTGAAPVWLYLKIAHALWMPAFPAGMTKAGEDV